MKTRTPPVVRWKRGARIALDALMVHNALEAIKDAKGGTFTCEDVVHAAKKKKHPLHEYFEWDDAKAGHQYRLRQAQYLTYKLEIIIQEDTDDGSAVVPVDAFQSLGAGLEDGKDSCYHDSRDVISDTELRERVAQKILLRLLSLKRKFSAWKEFSEVWDAISRIEERIAEEG